MKKPAHKDLEHPPGQLKWDCLDNKLSEDEHTLGDYIKRKEKQYDVGTSKTPKLTFEEWYVQSGWAATHNKTESSDDADSCRFIMEQAWKAAQENK